MSTVSEVITTTIEVKDAAVSQTGFGVPLIAASHNYWPELVRTFQDADELLADGIEVPATHPIYLMARALKAQTPSPDQFKVGKRTGTAQQIVLLTPLNAAVGAKYSFSIDGVAYNITSTGSTATAVSTQIGEALASVDGLEVTAASNASIKSIDGARHSFEALSSNLTIKETTTEPTPSVAADLTAIRAADGDWYALLMDANGAAEIEAAAAWAEAQEQRVLLFVTTQDSEVLAVPNTGVEGYVPDVGEALRLAGYNRTAIMYHHRPQSQEAAAAWVGRVLPKAPGSATWANKSLAGVDVSTLDDTARAQLTAKNVNYYVAVKGVGFTLHGVASSGRFIDITQGMDWFEARVQERIVGLFANNDKVPYTDNGAELARAQVVAQVLEGISSGVIDGDSPWSVTVPLVAAVNPNDKIARKLPGLKFRFVLQGAVHKVEVSGTVLVAL